MHHAVCTVPGAYAAQVLRPEIINGAAGPLPAHCTAHIHAVRQRSLGEFKVRALSPNCVALAELAVCAIPSCHGDGQRCLALHCGTHGQ